MSIIQKEFEMFEHFNPALKLFINGEFLHIHVRVESDTDTYVMDKIPFPYTEKNFEVMTVFERQALLYRICDLRRLYVSQMIELHIKEINALHGHTIEFKNGQNYQGFTISDPTNKTGVSAWISYKEFLDDLLTLQFNSVDRFSIAPNSADACIAGSINTFISDYYHRIGQPVNTLGQLKSIYESEYNGTPIVRRLNNINLAPTSPYKNYFAQEKLYNSIVANPYKI